MQHQSFEPMPDVSWGHDPMGTMVYSPAEDHCLNTHQTRLGYSEIELAKADDDQANQAIADRDWYLRHDDLDRAVTAQQQADQSAENRDYHLGRIEPTPSA